MTFRPRLPKPVASGFAVEGPGLYVWQETKAEALDWQRELSSLPGRVTEFHQSLNTEGFAEQQARCRRFWLDWLSAEGFWNRFILHFPGLSPAPV